MSTSCLDHPVLAERLFYAWPNQFPDVYRVGSEGGALGCWYGRWFPRGLTIIHFHGNGETVGEYLADFAGRIRGLGVNLLLAEYRGYGMSDGEPRLAAMLDDIPAIVTASGAAPEKLIFFGRSLGSLYAIHAASLYPGAAGLVLESAIADPLERILARVEPRHLGVNPAELRAEVDRLFNQREKLAVFSGRTFVMHTRNDELLDVSHGERLYAWAREPKELAVFGRGGHNNIMEVNLEEYFARLGRFLAPCRGDSRD